MSSESFCAIGIFSRPRRADITDIVRPLLEWLSKRGIRGIYDTETAASLRDGTEGRPRELLAHESDLLLVVGGDGTLRAAAREAARRGIPILPLKRRSLGVLTSFTWGPLYPRLGVTIAGHLPARE